MLHKTRGIVFSSTEYKETSIVVRIYTELFGVQSYIINSVRKKHPRIHANIFQPFTPVDLVVYHKEHGGLQRVSEIRPNPAVMNIQSDVVKSSMVFFLDEVLVKCIREEEPNPTLFEFIYNSIQWLDKSHHAGNDFHLVFLFRLSRYLGFSPVMDYSADRCIFNLLDGIFQNTYPSHPHFISPPLSGHFASLASSDFSTSLNINASERRALINYMLEYFEVHVEGFGNIKSHKVLEQVWEV